MRQIEPFGDEQVLAACIYCGAADESRDHIPSRVLLDEPFPENLPVVPCCRICNSSFSLDEEYCAALIDCVTVGTADPSFLHRPKVRHILERQRSLAAALRAARTCDPATGATAFAYDSHRMKNVVLKLARGHAAFELHTVNTEAPRVLGIAPLCSMNEDERKAFEASPAPCLLPEVGSRAMIRMFVHGTPSASWLVVQTGRYRFLASPGPVLLVRLVIGEYLAAEVAW